MANHSKTDNALKNALLRLFTRKHYLDITVTDLVKEAGVARASFYRHYHSIDDVANDYVEEREGDMTSFLLPILVKGEKTEVVKALTDILSDLQRGNDPFLRLLPDNRTYLMGKLSVGPHMLQRYGELSPDQRYGPIVGFTVIYTVASNWVREGFPYSSEQIADYIYRYIYRAE